jgi:SAM-dependent methyltransferase
MQITEIEGFFARAYSSQDRYWWKGLNRYATSPDDHPASLMTQQILRLATSRPPGRAIDLGSGEGADAIRLALLGWDVEAVELSRVGADKIQSFAAEAGAHIRVHHADITEFEPDGLFDLVICNGVLHYIDDKAAACRRIQAMTLHGGVNAISLWSSYTPVPDCHQVVPTFPDTENGEVVNYYASWMKSLLYFERDRAEMGHTDMPRHSHSHIKMVATKPLD